MTLAEEEEAAEMCELVHLPETGYIRYTLRLQGRGRWDGYNDTFRRIVICQQCGTDSCNKRMWQLLDSHSAHYCQHCLSDIDRAEGKGPR